MTKKNILLKNFSSLTLLQFSNYLFPIITLPYLLRVLGADNYGLMVFASAFAAYFIIITDYGFNLSIPPILSVNKTDKDKIAEIFSSVIVVKTLLFAISSIIFFLLVESIELFAENKTVFYLSYLAVLGNLLFPIWLFQGLEKLHLSSIISIIIKGLSVVLIFLLINSSNDLHLLILINSLSSVAAGLVSIVIIFSSLKIKLRKVSFNELKNVLINGYHLFISSLSINIYTTSNVFFLGLIAGEAFAGYYSAADKIRIAVQNIFSPITQTIYPHLSELFSKSVSAGMQFLRKIFYTAGALIFFVCTMIFIFSPQIINLAAGEGYESSIIVLKILAFLPFIIFMSNLAGIQIMLNLGYKESFNRIIMSAAFISLLLTFILVPFYFEIGTAAVFLITECFVTAAAVFFVRTKMKLTHAAI